MKKFYSITLLVLSFSTVGWCQPTFPVNGVADPRTGFYAFVHATIFQNPHQSLSDATLIIREGKILAVGKNIEIPKAAIEINCQGKYIYPSFIDLYTNYGMPEIKERTGGSNLATESKGAFGWNPAIRSQEKASYLFKVDKEKAKSLRNLGFGSTLTHQKDGIARGSGTFVTLADKTENLVMIREIASAHYSFNKGSSKLSYPNSRMGSIALLRQTYLDADWYSNQPPAEGRNISLEAWNELQALPQVFEANDKWDDLRADRIGDEFHHQYILKGGGNEYQRIKEMQQTGASFILPLNFPLAMDLSDPNEARFVSLKDLKEWEMAPGNPAAFEKAGISFCLTTSDLKETTDFRKNLVKALEYGLSDTTALASLTEIPARLIGLEKEVGTLEKGKLANFLITDGPVFNEKTILLSNWIQGEKYDVHPEAWYSTNGTYDLALNMKGTSRHFELELISPSTFRIAEIDTTKHKIERDGSLIQLAFPLRKGSDRMIRLSGTDNQGSWNGSGEDTSGNLLTWTATLKNPAVSKYESPHSKKIVETGKVLYPFQPYGWEEIPKQEDILIVHATVWTNEKEGVLENTDVLVKNGKIAAIGKDLKDSKAQLIDGTGKYLTSGIIDEHSHIAAASINEGGQSVTSEVRIGDNLNPDDINIYRQLSGGVTTSHILHGSANTIGGQTQLIKLRWGRDDEELKFAGAPGFIKFALGENVKRTYFIQGNSRYPDTRMGVDQVLTDAFTRARDYEAALESQANTGSKKGKKSNTPAALPVRRDLELDALVEVMNGKRFVTCHSYVQSEITDMIRVAEKFGFTLNTFTHILEGYKVADKMKAHGSNASTFSDWWEYKVEVQDAIPYNAYIMQRVGLNVAINSDDAEMARRLNQEAAKSIRYGGMSEPDAWKMVTLNPATMLHIEKETGSIKVGKDADLVLWSDDPLSIYAKALKTIVDGIVYFDRDRDSVMRIQLAEERNRIIRKMIDAKRKGAAVTPARPGYSSILHCEEDMHTRGLLELDEDQTN